MKNKIKEFLIFFIVQLILYTLFAINYRAINHLDYSWTMATNFVIASFHFFVFKKISDGHSSTHQWLGFALGSSVGGVIGLLISSHLLKN
jgi:hypothetical protein